MALNGFRWALSVTFLWHCLLIGSMAVGQDIADCEKLLSELLPTFNKAFEQNNPLLLRDEEYQKKLRQLQAAYTKYHAEKFSSSDSLRRLNNEAILLALSGNYHKALRLMEAGEFETDNQTLLYSRGLYQLLMNRYQAALSDFSESRGQPMSGLNSVYVLGRQKRYRDLIEHASSQNIKNSKGKLNYNLAIANKLEGNLETAVDELTAAIKHNDDIPAYRLQRGDILMQLGSEKKAVKDFEKMARKDPKARIRYANALLSLNQFGRARQVFEECLASTDRFFRGDAYLGMAHALYGLTQFSDAERYYKLAATIKRDNPSVLCGLANIHLSRHEYQFASTLFQKVIQNDSTFLQAYLGRAVSNFGMKHYAEAWADFKSAEKAMKPDNPFFADMYVTRGYTAYYLGLISDCRENFEKAIALDPTRYEALAGMGNVLINEKKYAEAGTYLAKALKYEQTYDKMWSNYGNLLLHFDMFKKGYQVFRKAIALNPKNINAQNGWGVVLLENDNLDRALVVFDSLVKSNPELPFLHNNHGIVQAYIGNRHEQGQRIDLANASYDNAFAEFRKAMETAPARKLYNVNQGNVYRYWEKFDEAKQSYQNYQDKSALNNTAVMYAGMDRMKDASYYLGVALKIDSLHRVFQYNMAVLVKGKQKEMMRLVASAGDDGPYSDIGIKYSLDGFVTIYLYDYEYDHLSFPGRHFMPLPVAHYDEDFFMPEFDFRLLAYGKKPREPKIRFKRVKDQKIKMPGKRGKSGTKCPVLW